MGTENRFIRDHCLINKAGGKDVLRIEGPPIKDGLYPNLSFEKLGSDLLVRLEMVGELDSLGDSVTIKDMANEGSGIETLTILDGTGKATAWIDLASVFDQLSETSQRFGITLDKTEFGHLTVPIG